MTSSKTLRLAIATAILAIETGTLPTAAGQSLRSRLTTRLDSLPLDRHVWGVAILDRSGRLLFGRNADRLFMPASNTKLLVTATAIRMLPPGWTTSTSLFAGGPIADGTLRGNLVLYGGGDPSWSSRCYAVVPAPPEMCRADALEPLRTMVGAVRRAGIRRVAGAVIGDGSFFESAVVHPTWETDDLVWGYAAPVSGLSFNENLVVATVSPGASVGAPAQVELEPDLGALPIENRAVTVDDSGPTDLSWSRSQDGTGAILTGTIRRAGPPDQSELAVADPNRFAALALARVLADSGIAVLGGIRSTTDSNTTATARRSPPLATVTSRPVEDWVFAILNASQNFFAETLLKQLGRQFGRAGSWDEGLRFERRFLIDSVGIDSTQFRAHDGSGLSAKNLASPLTFASILRSMRRHPRYQSFAAGLPRSGASGSLQKRFLTTPIEHRVRAKTGSIGQVNTLSGFIEPDSILDRRARPCRVFSIQANHHTLGGRTMVQAIDSIVVEVGRDTPCAKP